MPLTIKSTVTRRQAVPDADERALQAAHHQAAEALSYATPEPEPAQSRLQESEPEPSSKQLKREAHALQNAFLSANRGQPVVCYLLNGIKLTGRLRQFDQYCILLEGPDGACSLVFKHGIVTIQGASR